MDQGWGVEKTSEIQYFKKVDQSLTSPTLTWWTSWSSPGLSWQDRLCDTHKVCFYLSLRYAFSDPKSSVPGSGPSVLIIIAVMSTIITKNHWVIKVETSSREKMRLPNVTCASRAWQETHIEPIGPITPKLSNCSLQSSDCHFHCVSDGHCHYVFVIISSSPIGCHCLNISDILWLSMSLFFYKQLLSFGTLHMRGGQFPTSIISWNTLFKFIS